MKATEVIDLNVKYVNLTKGKYLVDGEVVEVNSYNSVSKVPVKDFSDVKAVTERSVVSYYICGEEKMSVAEYIEKDLKLTANRTVLIDSYSEEEHTWTSLEDEFDYKKFKRAWTPIQKTVQEISEPLLFEVEQRQIETGNPYIQSEFALGKDTDMFVYNQGAAYIGLLNEVMTELGMEFKGKLDYGQTKKDKVWGNSSHSNIEYVTAFGSYLFGSKSRFAKYYNSKGTLENLTAKYNTDREEIRTHVKDAYNEFFGKIDMSEFDFNYLLNKLRFIDNSVKFGDFKKSGETNYSVIKKNLREAIEQVTTSFNV